MKIKHLWKSVFLLIITVTLVISVSPAKQAKAEEDEQFLVIVEQKDKTYIAYDNLAVLTEDYLMVKAKPLADALDLIYRNGNGSKKGLTLKYGATINTYTRNSRTYYSRTGNASAKSRSAEHKQVVIDSYNTIYYDTLSPFRICKYYDTSQAPIYKAMGYSGIIVYGFTDESSTLANVTPVYNNKGKLLSINKVLAEKLTFNSSTEGIDPNWSNSANVIKATFSISNASNDLKLDLSDVLDAYKEEGLPSDGIYGYGNCDNSVTIQGIDKNGRITGEMKTNGKEFLVNFPNAIMLQITGMVKNFIIDFTPVKPTVIVNTTAFDASNIKWLPAGGCSVQYFILPENTYFNSAGTWTPNITQRTIVEYGNNSTHNLLNNYQSIMIIYDTPPKNLNTSSTKLQFKKLEKKLEIPEAVVYDEATIFWAANYPEELKKIVNNIKVAGLYYYPLMNWDKPLIIKVQNKIEHASKDYITIPPYNTELYDTNDYIVHLHEVAHFYDLQQPHYGINVQAWYEGNAMTLTQRSLIMLNVYDNSFFALNYNTDFSFMTLQDKLNFEDYYFNVKGDNAYIIGYHFTKFLQDTYGYDIVSRIMNKVYAANIPTDKGRTKDYDKKFAECIKSVTSQEVFNKFVEGRLLNYWGIVY